MSKKDSEHDPSAGFGSAAEKDFSGIKKEQVNIPREEYEQKIARLSELEALKDQLLRAAADFENDKKRLKKERDEFLKYSQESLIRSLLPTLDNLERALAHADSVAGQNGDPAQSLQGIVTGVQRVFKQFVDLLKNQGLVKISTAGEIFDPHRHEAVAYVEEPGKPDTILEEIEPGYLLHDRLLRAAKVRVRVSPQAGDASLRPPGAEEKQDEIT